MDSAYSDGSYIVLINDTFDLMCSPNIISSLQAGVVGLSVGLCADTAKQNCPFT